MKRSEVLNNIQDFIIDYKYYDNDGAEEVAKNILDYLEKIGMFPPQITILQDTYNRSDGSYGFEVNEWEPE
jgi:hypothetical protein